MKGSLCLYLVLCLAFTFVSASHEEIRSKAASRRPLTYSYGDDDDGYGDDDDGYGDDDDGYGDDDDGYGDDDDGSYFVVTEGRKLKEIHDLEHGAARRPLTYSYGDDDDGYGDDDDGYGDDDDGYGDDDDGYGDDDDGYGDDDDGSYFVVTEGRKLKVIHDLEHGAARRPLTYSYGDDDDGYGDDDDGYGDDDDGYGDYLITSGRKLKGTVDVGKVAGRRSL